MKTKIGKMNCESCGELVTVRRNEHGTLSYRCDECDAAPYSRPGTAQHGLWMGKIEQSAPATEPPAAKPATKEKPAPETKPEQKPAPAKTNNIWGLPS